jgi:hypothetical protein
MSNLYAQFRALIPEPPLQVGAVVSLSAGMAAVELPGGGILRARGSAAVGQVVFVRDGVIEGQAQNLTVEIIEV